MDPIVLFVLAAILLAAVAVIAAEILTGKAPDLIAGFRHWRRERERQQRRAGQH